MASTPDAPLHAHALATLAAMARVLYPHDFLEEAAYRRVVDIVVAGADAARRAMLAEGAAALDEAGDGRFVERGEKEKLAAVEALRDRPFFEVVRAGTARHLYDDRSLWPRFGYEGASHHLGGYIERGFDDIDWIADAEVEADR